jgi:hypothetical protein
MRLHCVSATLSAGCSGPLQDRCSLPILEQVAACHAEFRPGRPAAAAAWLSCVGVAAVDSSCCWQKKVTQCVSCRWHQHYCGVKTSGCAEFQLKGCTAGCVVVGGGILFGRARVHKAMTSCLCWQQYSAWCCCVAAGHKPQCFSACTSPHVALHAQLGQCKLLAAMACIMVNTAPLPRA